MSLQRASIHRSVIPVTLIDLNEPLIYRALLLLELKQNVVVPYLSDDRCKITYIIVHLYYYIVGRWFCLLKVLVVDRIIFPLYFGL